MSVKLGTLAIVAALCGASTVAAQERLLVLQGGTLIDGTGRPPITDAVVVVAGSRIRAVGRRGEVPVPAGATIIQANGLLVLNSVFKNTHGTRPAAGIDLEPDKQGQEITNVRIIGSKFLDNTGGGIMVAGKKARVSKVEMTRNVFRNNRPFLVENAPTVAASICGNRQVSA